MKTRTDELGEGVFAGGGEMGALIRGHDWSRSPLGSPQEWPQSLRSAVSICLGTTYPIAIYWGQDLALIYNDAWSSIPGNKHPGALGRPGREVWPEIWDTIGPLFAKVQTTGEGVWQQDQLLPMHRRGYTEECYFNFTFSPILGEDGAVAGIFNVAVETTFRVIGERREQALRRVAETLALARSEGEVFAAAADAISGYREDVPFCLFYRQDDGATAPQLVAACGLNGSEADVARSGRAAEAWPFADLAAPLQPIIVDDVDRLGVVNEGPWPEPVQRALALRLPASGATSAATFLVAGISPRLDVDFDYQTFFERLATHVSAALATARAYEEERRRAEMLAELDHAKTLFFSNVSHEFRTPLTLMLAPLEDALADSDHALAPAQRERLETAHRNSLRLLKLVNSLLDFSRIEAGRVEAAYEDVNLAEFTSELASNFRSAIEKAGLTFTLKCKRLPRPTFVDRDMWEKIVLNLLSNAFKFTFEGGISVELRAGKDTAELLVKDTGVGVPAHELPRLFERFHRVEGQQSRSFEGTGIGLALVHELVKLHGGSIRAESKLGKGTTFVVSIPYGSSHLPQERIGAEKSRASTSMRAEAFVEEALRWLPDAGVGSPIGREAEGVVPLGDMSGPRARILVVDDNADMREYVRRLLDKRWEVELAADGEAALAAIGRKKPDLLLSDIMMPKLDGFGLLRVIRDDPALRDLPCILLSARAGEEARVEGLDAGADDYLTKPFAARELIARVNANLELARVRREATRELRESEERFRNMADHSPVMMWVTDPTGYCTYLNRAWYEFTGQTEATGLGFGWLEATHPDDRDSASQIFLDANERRESFRLEYRLRRTDGVYRWAIDAASPRFDAAGVFLGYIGSVIDITDRKDAEEVLRKANEALEERVSSVLADRAKAEEQLRQAQKMEAVGKLTGGVAHDFNNVLQVIGGNLQLLSRDVAGNPRAEQRLQTAIAGVSRGSRLASQLLAFGRRQPLAPKVINLGRLVRGVDDMLRRALGEEIEVESIIAGGLWNTFVDVTQVENALLNLAINARDAMGGRGKLTIEAGNASLDDDYASRHADVAAGQYVMLAVTDTGTGIAPELLERVFEPFFTTKKEGHGTGLGLSMVYGFVKQSGGHVKIYSEPGQGTTVRLYLPRTRETEDLETVVDAGPVVGGTETVLVVEDDEDVRATVVEMLSELGYRVLKAKDAASGLAIIESGVPIDLLFSDVVMPGPMRSPELARKAKERLPGIAVLFTSGYTENAIVHGGRLDEGVELLSKPYTREAMARKLRQSLGDRPIKPRAEAQPARLKVLVVEDEMLIRLSTCDMLKDLGHDVSEATNATEALALLEMEKPDILLTDVGLPGVSGKQLAVMAFKRQPDLRFVFATGYDMQLDELPEGLPERCQVLRKPFDQKALKAVLASAVSARSGA